MRLLPRTVRGTWALAAAAWLAGCALAWPLLPARPRAEWRDVGPGHYVSAVLPDGPTVVAGGDIAQAALFIGGDADDAIIFLRHAACGMF